MKIRHFTSKRVLSSLFLFAALLLSTLSSSSIVHAQSDPPGVQGGTLSECSSKSADSKKGEVAVCFKTHNPTLVGNCENAQQLEYFTTNDLSDQPIYWTYANDNTSCVDVQADIPEKFPGKDCIVYMYIPHGYATDTLQLTLKGKSGHADKPTYTYFDQSRYWGWQALGLPAGTQWTDFQTIEFNDFDQLHPNLQIGWRQGSSFGAICKLPKQQSSTSDSLPPPYPVAPIG